MRNALAAILFTFPFTLSGCASRSELYLLDKLRQTQAQNRALEQALVWAQEDNVALQLALIKQEDYVQQLERGMVLQARMAAKWRATCEM